MTRPITISGYASLTPPASLGPAPQLTWLPIEQLVIDESYQRDITAQGRKNVRGIAENFSWTFFAPEVVECPACKGRLHLSIAAYNGHVHGKCETDGCVAWME